MKQPPLCDICRAPVEGQPFALRTGVGPTNGGVPREANREECHWDCVSAVMDKIDVILEGMAPQAPKCEKEYPTPLDGETHTLPDSAP